jgi:predicted nucleotidyltransferase
MVTIDVQNAVPALNADPNVAAAWIFGSAQGGSVRTGGDIDIGVLFVTKPGLDELADLRADLQDALAFDAIDLVVLNDASPILRFEAVSGTLIFCRELARRVAFVSLTAREYEHAMAMIERALADRKSLHPHTPADRSPHE